MQKTVTILNYESRREFSTDNFQCSIVFSVIDSALIGTPRPQGNYFPLGKGSRRKILTHPQPLARFSDPYPPEIKGIRNTSESFGTGALAKSDLEISLSLIRTTA
jgi:hypothetical protein